MKVSGLISTVLALHGVGYTLHLTLQLDDCLFGRKGSMFLGLWCVHLSLLSTRAFACGCALVVAGYQTLGNGSSQWPLCGQGAYGLRGIRMGRFGPWIIG